MGKVFEEFQGLSRFPRKVHLQSLTKFVLFFSLVQIFNHLFVDQVLHSWVLYQFSITQNILLSLLTDAKTSL